MAHTLYHYKCQCSDIHGYSCTLHVTVKPTKEKHEELVTPGFVIDFKELKEIVSFKILSVFDHKLVLWHEYVNSLETNTSFNNLFDSKWNQLQKICFFYQHQFTAAYYSAFLKII